MERSEYCREAGRPCPTPGPMECWYADCTYQKPYEPGSVEGRSWGGNCMAPKNFNCGEAKCEYCQYHWAFPTPNVLRTFDTGATRDTEKGKLDYEGFLSPMVIKRYAEYMHKHRVQSDGQLRDSDNWQKGIPIVEYMKSAWRHFMDVWLEHRGLDSREGLEDALCGLIFNAMGYLHEVLKRKENEAQNV